MKHTASLELFNAVQSKLGGSYMILPEFGIIVEPSASHAIDEIRAFYNKKLISGVQLNATFHKSWKKIIESSREELALHQILHYATTYGTGHTSSFVYIPDEKLEVPAMEVNFLVVRGLDKDELISRSLAMLESGVALKDDTITTLIELLSSAGYVFTSTDGIKNKEALMYICRSLGLVPSKPEEFVRYLVYLATNKTLLIKNKDTYRAIAAMSTEQRWWVEQALAKADIEALASVFNRFKPILLSFKKVLGINSKKIINLVSKLSKSLHEPMTYNILNNVGACSYAELEGRRDNLKNANFFQLARALQYLRQTENSDARVYNIRNGKSWVAKAASVNVHSNKKILFLLSLISEKYNLEGKKFFIPEGVHYALPTSEKLFVGNIPMGTKFSSRGSLAYGVSWFNDGGARDIDLSAIGALKVGWNSMYSTDGVAYSGDMTNAPRPDGATEFIRVNTTVDEPQIVFANIFSGEDKGSKFKICIGQGGMEIDRLHMMDPNKVWFSAETESLTKQSIVGFVIPEKHIVSAVVLNLAFGASRVSGSSEKNSLLRTALFQKWSNCFYLEELLSYCGAEFVGSPELADTDLTPSKLERDTILKLFTEK